MSDDPLVNPYAPPAEERGLEADDERRGRRRRGPDFEAERRSVGVAVLLSIVTLGAYTIIWLWRRRSFIDSFDTIRRDKLGRVPEVLTALFVASFVVSAVAGNTSPVSSAFSIGLGIGSLLGCFTVARALRSEIARTGRFIEISGVLVFFLGVLYLQYKINQIADTPPRRGRKKRKKKKPEVAE